MIDLPAPGYGYDIGIVLLYQRRRTPHSHLQQKVAVKSGRDFDDYFCAGRFLLSRRRRQQKQRE